VTYFLTPRRPLLGVLALPAKWEGPGVRPLEWGSCLFIAFLKIDEAKFKVGERGKVIEREHLSLDDREIDLNLIDPTGMNRGMHQKSVGLAGSDAIDCLLTTMSRAVIHDPKDALSGFVGFAAHDLSDEAIGGSNATLLFTVSEELGTVDVPSCQIGPSTLPEILVFNPHGRPAATGKVGCFRRRA